MNERIKKLAEQAGFQSNPLKGFIHLPGLNPTANVQLEKFAELIVKECYEHCRGQILDKEVADTNELTYNDAVGDCANGLLQHFGVEP